MKRIKDWEELTIQDNFLFQKVMRNKRLCQHLIEKILQIKIADITYPDTEKTIDIRLDSKSVRLDVYVKDDTGRVFNIEMQCSEILKCSAATTSPADWRSGRATIRP